jgi:hypothetical protein
MLVKMLNPNPLLTPLCRCQDCCHRHLQPVLRWSRPRNSHQLQSQELPTYIWSAVSPPSGLTADIRIHCQTEFQEVSLSALLPSIMWVMTGITRGMKLTKNLDFSVDTISSTPTWLLPNNPSTTVCASIYYLCSLIFHYYITYWLFSSGPDSTRSDFRVTIHSSPKFDNSMIATARSDLIGPVDGTPIYSPCPCIALTSISPEALTTPTAIRSTLFPPSLLPAELALFLTLLATSVPATARTQLGRDTLPLTRYVTSSSTLVKQGFSMYIFRSTHHSNRYTKLLSSSHIYITGWHCIP